MLHFHQKTKSVCFLKRGRFNCFFAISADECGSFHREIFIRSFKFYHLLCERSLQHERPASEMMITDEMTNGDIDIENDADVLGKNSEIICN